MTGENLVSREKIKKFVAKQNDLGWADRARMISFIDQNCPETVNLGSLEMTLIDGVKEKTSFGPTVGEVVLRMFLEF